MDSDDKLDLNKGMSELGEFVLIGEEWVIYKDQGNPRTGPALFHRCDIKHTRNKYGFHCYERDRRCPVCREIPKGDTLSMIELALGGTWSL